MIKTTRAQREALKRVYERSPICAKPAGVPSRIINKREMTYRQFRETVQPSFDTSGCVMVHWAGMWLGIERDGYTHS